MTGWDGVPLGGQEGLDRSMNGIMAAGSFMTGGLSSEASTAKNIFTVTQDGVVLPKGVNIPKNLIENPFRKSSYGEMIEGKFVEKLRIDPATPAGMKGPNTSYFHIDGKGKHIFDLTKWPK